MMLTRSNLRRCLHLPIIPSTICFLILVALTLYHTLPSHAPEKLLPTSKPSSKPQPLYKALPESPDPITDNFAFAAIAKSTTNLPPIPPWNAPPKPHVNESTPLFIGFTRNWPLLQQTVVSYITAGWPPTDIYVIENTGVMNSNRDGLLTLQNPFYLDHYRLTNILGINVISTPTILTFAQLQNFYIYTALDREWSHYFWAHMDTVVVSDEEYTAEPYQSLYMRAIAALRETLDPSWGPLATRWFAYDHLALVRTQAFVDVGGWDTMIPFYMTDCDMHERLWMKDFKITDAEAGKVWDVGSSLSDLSLLYKRGPNDEEESGETHLSSDGETTRLNSPAYQSLLLQLDDLQRAKSDNKAGRNHWQARQKGGQGEPFYRDSDGFEKALGMWMDLGRTVFEKKWGRGPCDIRDAGLRDGDAWRVVEGWEEEGALTKYQEEKATGKMVGDG